MMATVSVLKRIWRFCFLQICSSYTETRDETENKNVLDTEAKSNQSEKRDFASRQKSTSERIGDRSIMNYAEC